METIVLKDSDLEIARIGFGCCPMGLHGWGEVKEEELIEAVETALDLGVNFFDTADIYGLGKSEEILGKALKNRRDEAVIATKFGVRRSETGSTVYDNSSPWIRKAVEGSLRRLNCGVIDLYQIHYPDEKTPLEEVFASLEALCDEGKIRYYGLSNIKAAQLPGQLPPRLKSFQLEYSLASRQNEAEIDALLAAGLTFFSWGSLGQAILSGKYRKEGEGLLPGDRRTREIYTNFHGDKLAHNLAIVDEMNRWSRQLERTLPQIALRWIMDGKDGAAPLVGIKNAAEIRDSSGALDWHLPQEATAALDRVSRRPHV